MHHCYCRCSAAAKEKERENSSGEERIQFFFFKTHAKKYYIHFRNLILESLFYNVFNGFWKSYYKNLVPKIMSPKNFRNPILLISQSVFQKIFKINNLEAT